MKDRSDDPSNNERTLLPNRIWKSLTAIVWHQRITFSVSFAKTIMNCNSEVTWPCDVRSRVPEMTVVTSIRFST